MEHGLPSGPQAAVLLSLRPRTMIGSNTGKWMTLKLKVEHLLSLSGITEYLMRLVQSGIFSCTIKHLGLTVFRIHISRRTYFQSLFSNTSF